MLVTFDQSLAIGEYFNFDRFNELVLTDGRQFTPTAVHEPGSPEAAALAQDNLLGRITLDDGRNAQNPDPAIHPNGATFDLMNRFRGGDTLQDVTGVLDFAFGLYRIQPTQGAGYTAANPRPPQHDPVGGNVKVASFNVLNYFTTLGSRGADTAEEFARQRAKIIDAITRSSTRSPGSTPTWSA
jgi:predicted extracellular nuclease